MPKTLTIEDAALQELIQELALPIRRRTSASQHELTRSFSAGSNRRRAPRIDLVESDVVVEVEKAIVRPVDFSLRGVQFHIDSRLVPGSSVTMRIRQGGDASAALGRVMWAAFEKVGQQTTPYYRVGVVLENTDVRTVRAILARCGLERPVGVH